MIECQNCGNEFDEAEIINGIKVCPNCKSGDVIDE